MALHLNGINSLRIVLATSVARAVLGLGAGALGFRVLGLSSFGVGILAGELAASLMTGRYFVKHELAEKGLKLSAAALGPVTLSTSSTLVFFVGAGLGWWSGEWSCLAALTVVAASAIWGWKTLDHESRTRLTSLAKRWSPLRLSWSGNTPRT